MKQNYHQPLVANGIYHLFSRAVGNEKLFLSHDNYLYFLQKLKLHTSPICKLYVYTLLPNHFHLLVRIENEHELVKHFEFKKNKVYDMLRDSISDFIMERFSNFLNGYTKAYNKMYNRKGALFLDYLKRTKSNDDFDFCSFIFYVHKNAVHHGYTKKIGQWQYDSYNSIISKYPTSLLREEINNFFGNKEAFINFHKQSIQLKQEFIDF